MQWCGAYDFPLTEKDMRVYIPNVVFGGSETAIMKRFVSFWFKSWSGSCKTDESENAVIRALVLIATRNICNEELYLKYRLSNAKRGPEWYVPVDSEEDERRWGNVSNIWLAFCFTFFFCFFVFFFCSLVTSYVEFES
jgi:hypothetical protein